MMKIQRWKIHFIFVLMMDGGISLKVRTFYLNTEQTNNHLQQENQRQKQMHQIISKWKESKRTEHKWDKETNRCSGKSLCPLGALDGAVLLTTINSITTHSRCSGVQSHDYRTHDVNLVTVTDRLRNWWYLRGNCFSTRLSNTGSVCDSYYYDILCFYHSLPQHFQEHLKGTDWI